MSETDIIAVQWDCLTEPERAIANIITDNIALGTPFIAQDVADAMFEDARGADWEIYRDQWMANWAIIPLTVTILGVELAVYTTTFSWPFGIVLCRADDKCGVVTVRCRAVRGFP